MEKASYRSPDEAKRNPGDWSKNPRIPFASCGLDSLHRNHNNDDAYSTLTPHCLVTLSLLEKAI